MPCMKANPSKQVTVINSSFSYTTSFSKTKEKEKNQPHIQQSWNLILRKFHKKLRLWINK